MMVKKTIFIFFMISNLRSTFMYFTIVTYCWFGSKHVKASTPTDSQINSLMKPTVADFLLLNAIFLDLSAHLIYLKPALTGILSFNACLLNNGSPSILCSLNSFANGNILIKLAFLNIYFFFLKSLFSWLLL